MTNRLSRALARWLPLLSFKGSNEYWTRRYALGGDSGAGSDGASARYKAQVLNRFVSTHSVDSIIEFGCGDGRQLALAAYPDYTGVDISPLAIDMCRERFAGNSAMRFMSTDDALTESADLAISLDVIFHLVEDNVYDAYLTALFAAARRFVVVYATDEESVARTFKHVRHRNVSRHVGERFPDFLRLVDEEADLPPPVEQAGGVTTRFLLYRRR